MWATPLAIMEIKDKTNFILPLTPIQITIIRKSTDNEYEYRCGGNGTYISSGRSSKSCSNYGDPCEISSESYN